MLVVGLVGGAGVAEEVVVVEEAAALGAHDVADRRRRGSMPAARPPVSVSLIGGGLHSAARLPLLLHPGHALALELALTRGCDPDAPRHLGQVVILGPNERGRPPTRRLPATIVPARAGRTRSAGRGSRSSTRTTTSGPRSAATGRRARRPS